MTITIAPVGEGVSDHVEGRKKRPKRVRRLIGLDTNILLRATLNDDAGAVEGCAALIEEALARTSVDSSIVPVLLEFLGLGGLDTTPRGEARGRSCVTFSASRCVEFEALEVVGKALATYEGGIADFADMIIALRNR